MIKVEKYELGIFATNTYIIENNLNEVILIDPASKFDKISSLISNRKLIAIILTHGHFDHIKAVNKLSKYYNCNVYLNDLDLELAKDIRQAQIFGIENTDTVDVETINLKEGNLKLSTFDFEVYHTPGHSKGSVCLKIENYLFTGDTLFRLSVGRCDLKGGSIKQLEQSLIFLKTLNPNLIVMSGHEQASTLQFEIENNINLKYL